MLIEPFPCGQRRACRDERITERWNMPGRNIWSARPSSTLPWTKPPCCAITRCPTTTSSMSGYGAGAQPAVLRPPALTLSISGTDSGGEGSHFPEGPSQLCYQTAETPRPSGRARDLGPHLASWLGPHPAHWRTMVAKVPTVDLTYDSALYRSRPDYGWYEKWSRPPDQDCQVRGLRGHLFRYFVTP